MNNIRVEICRCFYGGYDTCSYCSSSGVIIHYTDEECVKVITIQDPIHAEMEVYRKEFKNIKILYNTIKPNFKTVENAHKIFSRKLEERKKVADQLDDSNILNLFNFFETEVQKLLYFLDDRLIILQNSELYTKYKRASITVIFSINSDNVVLYQSKKLQFEEIFFKVKLNSGYKTYSIKLSELYLICKKYSYSSFICYNEFLRFNDQTKSASTNIVGFLNTFNYNESINSCSYQYKGKAYKSLMLLFNNSIDKTQLIYFMNMKLLLDKVIEGQVNNLIKS